MNYYEKHIGDFIRDTVSLTMLEDGAYNRLMDQCYQTERPLPLDRKLIYRLARATSTTERRAVDFVVESFFQETDGGFIQKRIHAEIERYKEKQRKARASANARWNGSEGNANASPKHDATDMRTHSEGNAHQSPVTNNPLKEKDHLSQSLSSPGAGDPAQIPERDDPAAPAEPLAEPAYLPTGTAYGAMAKRLRALGVQVASHNPILRQWVDDGVSPDEAAEAVDLAREHKPAPEPIAGAYLDKVLRSQRTAATGGKMPAARETDSWGIPR